MDPISNFIEQILTALGLTNPPVSINKQQEAPILTKGPPSRTIGIRNGGFVNGGPPPRTLPDVPLFKASPQASLTGAVTGTEVNVAQAGAQGAVTALTGDPQIGKVAATIIGYALTPFVGGNAAGLTEAEVAWVGPANDTATIYRLAAVEGRDASKILGDTSTGSLGGTRVGGATGMRLTDFAKGDAD